MEEPMKESIILGMIYKYGTAEDENDNSKATRHIYYTR